VLALKVAVAVVAAAVLWMVAVRLVRFLLQAPPPPEPDLSALRPVDLTYECVVCGARVTMTAAPDGTDPEPPRHCREDMQLVE